MVIPFDPTKVAQAAALLMRREAEPRMSRLRLLKLLYVADRELLQERCRPLTGDNAVAMENGPVLMATYDLIKGIDDRRQIWAAFFRNEGRDIHLITDPGVGKLSRKEIQKLEEVSARFIDCDDWALAEYTHAYPEWLKNKPSAGNSNPISIDDLLDATGLSAHKAELLANEKAEAAMEQILA
jgi:uncharacterized phage-associated protein